MKRCYICDKEIPDENGEYCKDCSEFFKWKYDKRFKKILRIHKENTEQERLKQIKFRRKK